METGRITIDDWGMDIVWDGNDIEIIDVCGHRKPVELPADKLEQVYAAEDNQPFENGRQMCIEVDLHKLAPMHVYETFELYWAIRSL